MEIVDESLETWLSVLKPYQRKTIKALLANNDGDEEKDMSDYGIVCRLYVRLV